jgi:Chromo (CHRromatin Organisation MOdifier) domain
MSDYTYKLELPASMARLHPVFHVSLLWKEIPEEEHLIGRLTSNRDTLGNATALAEANVEEENIPTANASTSAAAEVENEENYDPELFIDEDGTPVYQLEKVVERKTIRNTFHYLVKWKGYGDKDNSWITRKLAVTPSAMKLLNDFDTKLRNEAK